MYMFATLDQLRTRLGLTTIDTADDQRLIGVLQASAAQIERATGRRFCPRQKAIQHNYSSSLELLLDDDLLELTSLINGDGSLMNLTDVIPVPDEAPYSYLRLTGSSAFTWNMSPLQAVTISGIWGWHDRPTEMWRTSGDTVQNNPFGISAATLTVTDADGADNEGSFPRFQVGHLLKIDSEYLRVTAVNTLTNVLTVLRAANGTTAASHTLNTPIYTYQPPAEVNDLAQRWASWLYKEAESVAFAVPSALQEALSAFRRVEVKV